MLEKTISIVTAVLMVVTSLGSITAEVQAQTTFRSFKDSGINPRNHIFRQHKQLKVNQMISDETKAKLLKKLAPKTEEAPATQEEAVAEEAATIEETASEPENVISSPNGEYKVIQDGNLLTIQDKEGNEIGQVKLFQTHVTGQSLANVTNEGLYIISNQRGNISVSFRSFTNLGEVIHKATPGGKAFFTGGPQFIPGTSQAYIYATDRKIHLGDYATGECRELTPQEYKEKNMVDGKLNIGAMVWDLGIIWVYPDLFAKVLTTLVEEKIEKEIDKGKGILGFVNKILSNRKLGDFYKKTTETKYYVIDILKEIIPKALMNPFIPIADIITELEKDGITEKEQLIIDLLVLTREGIDINTDLAELGKSLDACNDEQGYEAAAAALRHLTEVKTITKTKSIFWGFFVNTYKETVVDTSNTEELVSNMYNSTVIEQTIGQLEQDGITAEEEAIIEVLNSRLDEIESINISKSIFYYNDNESMYMQIAESGELVHTFGDPITSIELSEQYKITKKLMELQEYNDYISNPTEIFQGKSIIDILSISAGTSQDDAISKNDADWYISHVQNFIQSELQKQQITSIKASSYYSILNNYTHDKEVVEYYNKIAEIKQEILEENGLIGDTMPVVDYFNALKQYTEDQRVVDIITKLQEKAALYVTTGLV